MPAQAADIIPAEASITEPSITGPSITEPSVIDPSIIAISSNDGPSITVGSSTQPPTIVDIVHEELDYFDVRYSNGVTAPISKRQALIELPRLVTHWRKNNLAVWKVKAIVGEKAHKFKISWDGTDANGQPWPDTWEAKYDVGTPAIDHWRRSNPVPVEPKSRGNGTSKKNMPTARRS